MSSPYVCTLHPEIAQTSAVITGVSPDALSTVSDNSGFGWNVRHLSLSGLYRVVVHVDDDNFSPKDLESVLSSAIRIGTPIRSVSCGPWGETLSDLVERIVSSEQSAEHVADPGVFYDTPYSGSAAQDVEVCGVWTGEEALAPALVPLILGIAGPRHDSPFMEEFRHRGARIYTCRCTVMEAEGFVAARIRVRAPKASYESLLKDMNDWLSSELRPDVMMRAWNSSWRHLGHSLLWGGEQGAIAADRLHRIECIIGSNGDVRESMEIALDNWGKVDWSCG